MRPFRSSVLSGRMDYVIYVCVGANLEIVCELQGMHYICISFVFDSIVENESDLNVCTNIMYMCTFVYL